MALFNSMKNTSRSLLKKLCCKATRNLFFPARYLTIAKNVFTIDVTIECTISTYRFDESVPVFDENNAFSKITVYFDEPPGYRKVLSKKDYFWTQTTLSLQTSYLISVHIW